MIKCTKCGREFKSPQALGGHMRGGHKKIHRKRPASQAEQYLLLADTTEPSQEEECPNLPPWQRKASEKAVERYAEAQERKWCRWNDAMFKRSS